jgi:hypothetical protein
MDGIIQSSRLGEQIYPLVGGFKPEGVSRTQKSLQVFISYEDDLQSPRNGSSAPHNSCAFPFPIPSSLPHRLSFYFSQCIPATQI